MSDPEPTIPERAFDNWKRRAQPGERYRYHHGDLGSDKRDEPELDALSTHLLRAARGRFDVISECGHRFREEIVGADEVELLQRADGGQRSYLAERRKT